ncbi:hypothetical protein [Jeotgalibaca porci]|uniref:hypothetical protein n=1 Tax=Jeotgalibaca porci TaxID=1868793 RepID=UPI0035A18139
MNSEFDVSHFLSPLENAEQVLEMLNDFYKEERFSNIEDAKKLIESYEEAIRTLKEVADTSGK